MSDVPDGSDAGDASGSGSGARWAVAVSAGVIAYALGYALPIYAHLPRPFYDPLARHWFVARSAAPIPMGYLGQVTWATLLALVVAAATFAIARKPATARGLTLAAAWTLTALAIVAGYFTWNNWP